MSNAAWLCVEDDSKSDVPTAPLPLASHCTHLKTLYLYFLDVKRHVNKYYIMITLTCMHVWLV